MTQSRFDKVRIGDPIFYRETREWARVTSTQRSAGRRMIEIGISFPRNDPVYATTIICDRHAVAATEAAS